MPLPFDNPDAADSADMTDSNPATIAAGPAPAPGGAGGDFDNPDNPDSPDMTDGAAAPPASVTGVLVNVSAPVAYVPDPQTAALTLTQGGQTFGPYPATVTQAAGGYILSATFTAAVLPGAASVQPGDLLPGGFVPNGPPVTGPLSASPALPDSSALPDIALTAGPVQTSIFDPDSSCLLAGSNGWLHVLITAQSNQPDEGGSFPAFDVTTLPVALAASPSVSVSGGEGFWPGDWLSVPSGPAAGVYARLRLSAQAGNTLSGGAYFVSVQIGNAQVVMASTVLIVQG